MAEFQEVIRQRNRMCEARESCVGCPLKEWGFSGRCNLPTSGDENEYEEIVMKWASENPDPQYPTWGEWFHKTFPKGNIGCFSPCAFYDDCESCKRCGGCNDFYFYTPIPADIAEKLGIKPIERSADDGKDL